MEWLWLVPTLPLLGFLVLSLGFGRLPRPLAAWVGVGSVGLSALVALWASGQFLALQPPAGAFTQTLWNWIHIGGFSASVGLRLDRLSLVMMLVVTGVGFLIHLYSAEYMAEDEGFERFFAYLNLFVAAMLVLVLADDLLFLFLGWEGVGLCSYLLIGFWYRDAANGAAARKAFVVTRVGDVAMTVGLLFLATRFGTLNIQGLMHAASAGWPQGSVSATIAAALLLGGALGKSAQLPLQVWLPDAMAGPTPVSALIHAATMVTAGVYLIARTHVLFALAPLVEHAVAIIGAATLVLAGFSALVQRDIKRILAYSTISQIGYMFLANGVGAWGAAIFHFMSHAFFKALLFLAAGVVIHALDGEHDIFRMGGLRRMLPQAFWPFLAGGASLAALPLVTAGFYSKDLILWDAWSSPQGSAWLWAAGWVGALLTGLYTFRLIFIAFFGESRTLVRRTPGWRIGIPLGVLSVLALVGGLVELPPALGDWPGFTRFLAPVLPPLARTHTAVGEGGLEWLAVVASVGGTALAWLLFLAARERLAAWLGGPEAEWLRAFWFADWGFDRLYEILFVGPYYWLARLNRNDIVDAWFDVLAWLNRAAHRFLSATQSGRLRWYAAGMMAGVIILIGLVVAV